MFGGRCFGDNTLGECGFSRKKKTGQVRQVGRSRKRESGLQVPGSILGRGEAVTGAGQVGCLLTTDKLGFFRWKYCR